MKRLWQPNRERVFKRFNSLCEKSERWSIANLIGLEQLKVLIFCITAFTLSFHLAIAEQYDEY